MALTDEEYWKQGTDRLEEYHAAVETIIAAFPEPRRTKVREMMAGPIGEQFMIAPASTRRSFHNAFPCGLVAHSLSVVKYAVQLAKTLAPGRWPPWKVMFVALFHDLGKAGSPGKPYYVQTKDDWKRKKDEFYDVSKEEYMPNSEKSLYLMQLHGIVLDHEETAAIRLNDGAGAKGNEQWAFNEPDLALIVHWADHWASKQEKAAGKKG
ncbi:MAG TPA: HD domain-containing protein [Isosphaeraceae bacterium]|nr:HD domain-containing protein [Isosphaeraceae bacterium]